MGSMPRRSMRSGAFPGITSINSSPSKTSPTRGLSRDYIYLPERGRNIMVDARAVQAALDHAYDADRIVEELLTGRLFETEVEADRARR
jgi:Peptidase S46